MAQITLSARELEVLIRGLDPRLNNAQFNVHKDATGWSATFMGLGPTDPKLQIALKHAVDSLREQYDLQEMPAPGPDANMTRAEDCRRQAEVCDELAKTAPNPEIESLYLDLAKKWRQIAAACDQLANDVKN